MFGTSQVREGGLRERYHQLNRLAKFVNIPGYSELEIATLLEAQLRTVPRPGQNAKAAMAGLKLVGSIAKSAATMSFDPAVLTNLRDCAHLAFDEVRRRMHERMGQAPRPPLESARAVETI